MSDHVKTLSDYTIAKGAPFPFRVEAVADLADWTEKPLTVAVCDDHYRVAGHGRTSQLLRSVIAQLTGGELTEYTPPATPTKPKTTTSRKKREERHDAQAETD